MCEEGKCLECAQIEINELRDFIRNRNMRCTWCGYEVCFDDENEEEKEAARKDINAHALICEKDPRTIELAALQERVRRLEAYLTEALDDNYWHSEGCQAANGDECNCWVGKAQAALRGDA